MSDYGIEDTFLLNHILRIAGDLAAFNDWDEVTLSEIVPKYLYERSLTNKSGMVTDMVFLGSGDAPGCCMRPDGTMPTAHLYDREDLQNLGAPAKLFYHGQMYQNKHPHYAFGGEVLGGNTIKEIYSAMKLGYSIIDHLSISCIILMNWNGCVACRILYHDKMKQFVKAIGKEKFCLTCRRVAESSPLKLFTCEDDKCRSTLQDGPRFAKHMCKECVAAYHKITAEIGLALGMPLGYDDTIIRGPHFYNGLVWNYFNPENNAIMGGGAQHKGIIRPKSKENNTGVGFAVNIEELMYLVEQDEEKRACGVDVPPEVEDSMEGYPLT